MISDLIPLKAEMLAARLHELGVTSPGQLEQAKEELIATQERFSMILVRLGIIRDVDAGKRLAPQLGMIPQHWDAPPSPTMASANVPPMVWRLHRVVPVHETKETLLLATDDPFSVFALEFFSRRCSCPVEAVLITEQDLAPLLAGLERQIGAAPTPSSPPPPSPPREAALPARQASTTIAQAVAGQGSGQEVAAQDRPSEDPIIRLVDSMFSEAVRLRASDIHVEPGKQHLQIRYRIDGVLHDVNTSPLALQGSLVSRIKIVSGLNIAEKRLPQDGRLQLEVGGRELDVRVSILPAMHGESVVMRVLDRSQPVRGLKAMGLRSEDQQLWDTLIRRPHGIVLVTGPTGSGKTTTLYGALSVLNQTDRKLITIEDPVEYQLPGVNQVVVRSTIGLTFAAGLRSMLRQAPDVIMVGEIRDQETAQIAIQAALTGHLVLSTLHTNDAPSAVTRLIDMGVAPFLVASTLQGILAQRLVRRICPECRMTDNATAEERAFLGTPEVVQVIRSNGCDRCHESGYFGRIGLFELLTMNDALRQLVVKGTAATDLRTLARRQGMRTLRDDGCHKVREGLTTVAEVLRVVVAD